jgi:transcriptional regulator with XRE-family HTH domain
VLLEETLKLLNADGRPMEEIALASGLSYSWITKLRTGVTTDPRVTNLEKLNTFLKKSRRKAG